jgi:hypothetical protein
MRDGATRALDDAFLAMVADWSAGGEGCDEPRFEAQALALFAYQFERNAPYRRYAESLGFEPARRPYRRAPSRMRPSQRSTRPRRNSSSKRAARRRIVPASTT